MGNLLRAEWYKLFHDKIFAITLAACVLFNTLIFSGSSILSCSGSEALQQCMKKEIMTAMIVCIYGGTFLGSDFADRTMYHGLTAGQSRGAVLHAKIIVFSFAADLMLFLFPLLLTVICTVKNGWGTAIGTGFAPHLFGVVLALLLLGFAISAISLPAAVCFRDVGRTIGIPIVLYFIVIILLNSTFAPVLSRLFPISAVFLVTDGTVSAAYGMGLGLVWFALLAAVSTLIFRRVELR